MYSHEARMRAVTLSSDTVGHQQQQFVNWGTHPAACCAPGIVSSSNPVIFIETTTSRL